MLKMGGMLGFAEKVSVNSLKKTKQVENYGRLEDKLRWKKAMISISGRRLRVGVAWVGTG